MAWHQLSYVAWSNKHDPGELASPFKHAYTIREEPRQKLLATSSEGNPSSQLNACLRRTMPLEEAEGKASTRDRRSQELARWQPQYTHA